MKISKRQLRQIIREEYTRLRIRKMLNESEDMRAITKRANARVKLQYFIDDYIANPSDKQGFEKKIMDAMKEYVGFFNTEMDERERGPSEGITLREDAVLACTRAALDAFELKTTGKTKSKLANYAQGYDDPVDDLGHISTDLDMSNYEKMLIEDNCKELIALIVQSLENAGPRGLFTITFKRAGKPHYERNKPESVTSSFGSRRLIKEFVMDALGYGHSASHGSYRMPRYRN